MSNLTLRAITGAIYVTVTLAAAWAGPFTTLLLFLPVSGYAALEMHRLLWTAEEGPPPFWSVLLVLSVYVSTGLGAFDPRWTPLYTAAMAFVLYLISVTWMLLRGTPRPAQEAAGLLLLIVLVALPFGLLPLIVSHGTWLFVGFMLLLWTNDTGAYLVGRAVGRTPLLSRISPKKTLEGFVGGVVMAMAVGQMLSRYHHELSPSAWMLLGGLVGITGAIGDLLESAFKRARGVKDSGTILPGHGGMLDRFDGLLLAAPATALYLLLLS